MGKDKSTITGRSGQIPFDINIQGTKVLSEVSVAITFVRADMVVFVKPDLVVTVLGR